MYSRQYRRGPAVSRTCVYCICDAKNHLGSGPENKSLGAGGVLWPLHQAERPQWVVYSCNNKLTLSPLFGSGTSCYTGTDLLAYGAVKMILLETQWDQSGSFLPLLIFLPGEFTREIWAALADYQKICEERKFEVWRNTPSFQSKHANRLSLSFSFSRPDSDSPPADIRRHAAAFYWCIIAEVHAQSQ